MACTRAPPTFANTYQALEQSGNLLKRVLSTRFSHRLLAAAREAAIAHGQEDGWRLTLQNTTQQPQLQHLARRDTRTRDKKRRNVGTDGLNTALIAN